MSPVFRIELAIAGLVLCGCASSEDELRLDEGSEASFRGCRIALDDTLGSERVVLRSSCEVPQGSSLSDKEWWPTASHLPLGYTLDVGGCVRLANAFYCLEEVDDNSARLRKRFDVVTPEHIERVLE